MPRLIFLRLRDVPWTDYDLQGVRDHRKLGGLVPYDLPVDGEFQAPEGVSTGSPSPERRRLLLCPGSPSRPEPWGRARPSHAPTSSMTTRSRSPSSGLALGAAASQPLPAYRQLPIARLTARRLCSHPSSVQRDLLCAVISALPRARHAGTPVSPPLLHLSVGEAEISAPIPPVATFMKNCTPIPSERTRTTSKILTRFWRKTASASSGSSGMARVSAKSLPVPAGKMAGVTPSGTPPVRIRSRPR